MQWSDLAGMEDPQTILRPLASYMRPKLINSLKERRKALFTENAEKMKHLLDNLQKKLDEVSTFMTADSLNSVFWHSGYLCFVLYTC